MTSKSDRLELLEVRSVTIISVYFYMHMDADGTGREGNGNSVSSSLKPIAGLLILDVYEFDSTEP